MERGGKGKICDEIANRHRKRLQMSNFRRPVESKVSIIKTQF